VKRKIIQIDEARCDGCGLCVPACAEGAIRIVDGKARLVSDPRCDGLGACLGECPQDALRIVEREAEEFDESLVPPPPTAPARPHAHGGAGCPSTRLVQLACAPAPGASPAGELRSALGHWPVKLRLVPPHAPFLDGAELVLAADCVPFAFPALHRDILPGRAVLIGCPKFDEPEPALERLTAILKTRDVRSLTVVHMQVPCCHGYLELAARALAASGKRIPFHRVEIALDGRVLHDNRAAEPAPQRREEC
jgi:Pyruvate/2-oxoacid:ferredoxin oxidoreductase delta subunit